MKRLLTLIIGLEEIADENDTIVKYINFHGKLASKKGMAYEKDGETYIYMQKGMKERQECKVFADETGHVYKGICHIWTLPNIADLFEERAHNWSATYRVSKEEYMKCMRNMHINSDYDMAEELEVEIDAIIRARKRYAADGEFVTRSPEYYD